MPRGMRQSRDGAARGTRHACDPPRVHRGAGGFGRTHHARPQGPCRFCFAARGRLSYGCAPNHGPRSDASPVIDLVCRWPPNTGLRANGDAMLPDFRFLIGAILATTVLGVAAFGLATSVRLSHQAKISPLEASRSFAFAERNERSWMPDQNPT